MESSLKKIVEDYNKQRGGGGGDVTNKNPSAKVISLLSLHYLKIQNTTCFEL